MFECPMGARVVTVGVAGCGGLRWWRGTRVVVVRCVLLEKTAVVTTLHWVTSRHIKNWYLQRAVLAGYDRVLSAARVAVDAVVGGGGGGVHGLPWSAGS